VALCSVGRLVFAQFNHSVNPSEKPSNGKVLKRLNDLSRAWDLDLFEPINFDSNA
jgi:hypothetical protein